MIDFTFRRQHSLRTKQLILKAAFYLEVLRTLRDLRLADRTLH